MRPNVASLTDAVRSQLRRAHRAVDVLGLGDALNGPINGITGALGSTLDGINVPGGGGGTISPNSVGSAIAGLSSGEIAALQVQCSSILKRPGSFDRDLVSLCTKRSVVEMVMVLPFR